MCRAVRRYTRSMLHRVDRQVRQYVLLALLLATLAPSVAHALRLLRGESMPWSQLCSATGSKRVVFDWQADGQPSPRAHDSEQCAGCLLHQAGSAPPPVAATLALRADLQTSRPAPRSAAPRPSPAWHPAQARAPPQT